MIRLFALVLMLAAGLALAQEAPADNEPRITTELTPETVVVGQPAVLRVKVLVPTWMPQAPEFPSLDLPNLIVRLPERSTQPISERMDGQTWAGVSRAYRIYPMVPGDFSLSAQAMAIAYADPDTSKPVAYQATFGPMQFVATVPEGAEGLDPLIVASGLTLEQSYDGGDGPLGQGDAVTRTVTAKIDGSPAIFLPPLIPEIGGETVRAYPREPALQESENRGGISGSRTEAVTYVAQYGGTVDLPEIRLDWFNTETGAVETATLKGRSLTVDAPEAPPDAPPLPPRQVVLLAAIGVLVAMLVWAVARFVFPPFRRWRAARREARLASEAYAARQVEAAIAGRDLGAIYNSLARWSARSPGENGAGLEAALAAVGARRFGTSGEASPEGGWTELDAAFRAERAGRLARPDERALPPLNPV